MRDYHQQLEHIMKVADKVLGDLDYMQACIKGDIEHLLELRGEVCERAELITQALDLNRKPPKGGEE